MTEAAPRSTCSRQSHVISDKRPVPGGTDAIEVTGMLYGAKLLQFAGYPTAEVLGPDASEEDIKTLIEKHGSVFVKPVFKGASAKRARPASLAAPST